MSKKRKIPYQNAPCKNCPYLKSAPKGWLPHRIEEDVVSDSFVCHKRNDLQCAGHMILLKERNVFYRTFLILERQKPDLRNQELVFDSVEECVKHHKNA